MQTHEIDVSDIFADTRDYLGNTADCEEAAGGDNATSLLKEKLVEYFCTASFVGTSRVINTLVGSQWSYYSQTGSIILFVDRKGRPQATPFACYLSTT